MQFLDTSDCKSSRRVAKDYFIIQFLPFPRILLDLLGLDEFARSDADGNEKGPLQDQDTGIVSICCWLVVLGLNGPLRQYFSLYRAVSQREVERKEK